LQTDAVKVFIFRSGREEARIIGRQRRHPNPSGESKAQRTFGHFVGAEAIHVLFAQEVDASILLLVRRQLQSLLVESGDQFGAVERFRSDLRRRNSTVGCHDVHSKMAPRHGALRHVVDVVMVFVRNLEEAKALDVEIGGIGTRGRTDLFADQKVGILAELVDVVGGADLLDQNAVQVDVHAGVRVPRHFQIVPGFLLDAFDLRDPFSARNAEIDLQVAVSLLDFDGSGRNDVVVLIFGGGAVDLEARLHRQSLHALQRIPQAAAGVDLGLGVFALALKFEDVAVGGGLFFVGNGDELRVVDAGNRAGRSDDEDIVGSGSFSDVEESEIQSGNWIVKISEDEREILEMGSTQSPDGDVVKVHGSVRLAPLSGAAAKVKLLRGVAGASRGIASDGALLFVSVDVNPGSFFRTPTELEVVPRVGVQNAVHGDVRPPGISLRRHRVDEFAVFVLNVDSLTTGLAFAAAGDDVRSVDQRLVEIQPSHDGESLILRMLLHDVVPELRPFLQDEELEILPVDLNGFADNAVDVSRISVDFETELTARNVMVLDLFESQNSVANVSLARNQEFQFARVSRCQLVLFAM